MLSDALSWLGLFQKEARLVFLGLDNAGKTTLLHKLKDDRVSVNIPTLHPHSEKIQIEKTSFTTIDLGGHVTARKLWRDYYDEIDAIIFLVDAADPSRFPEAAESIEGLLSEETIANVPIAILGNKIDSPKAVPEDYLRQALKLYENTGYTSNGKATSRPVKLFMCSVVQQKGYKEAFKWINERLK